VEAARPFGISEFAEDGRRRLVLRGELDLSGAPELEAALDRVCREGAREVEVDLREVDFIDSAGLRALLVAKDECAAAGSEFFVVPARGGQQQRIFEMAGLQSVLPWRDASAPGPGVA
jgi:anti-sigma B factor antagonist